MTYVACFGSWSSWVVSDRASSALFTGRIGKNCYILGLWGWATNAIIGYLNIRSFVCRAFSFLPRALNGVLICWGFIFNADNAFIYWDFWVSF